MNTSIYVAPIRQSPQRLGDHSVLWIRNVFVVAMF